MVSRSGAATYTVPITIPPGTNGMAPKLSLVYNSQSGNGLVGMGWSIGGLSAITRCGATIAIDGFKGGVNYDANDRLCLDGERLISVGSGQYRTQHESWQTVTAVGSYFTVTNNNDGTIMTYGGTADSQIIAQGKSSIVRLWALNKIQDASGNYLTISYQNNGFSTGEYYPLSIAYTGNGAVAPYNVVYFDYSTTSRSDAISAYQGGSLISITKLLSGIRTCTDSGCTVGANGSLVRQYKLTYDNNGAMGRSRLTSIQECGTDGVCLPATVVGWRGGRGVNLTGYDMIGWQSGTPDKSWFTMADVNGDGKSDIVLYDPVGGKIYVSLASANIGPQGPFAQTSVNSTFVTAVNGTPSPANSWLTLADVNGDGRVDAVLYSPATGVITVALANSDGSFTTVSPSTSFVTNSSLSPTNSWFIMADVNGDGLADAVLYNPAAGTLTVALANGNGGFATPVTTYMGVNASPSSCWFTMADVNGDGRADAVWYDCAPLAGTLTVALATPTGGFASPYNTAGPNNSISTYPGNSWFTMADVNGDGLADAVLYNPNFYNTLSVSLAKGDGTFGGQHNTTLGADTTISPVNSWFMMTDINGDGLADAVVVNSSITVALAANSGFTASTTVNIGSGVSPSNGWATVGDANGDGASDLVMYGSTIVESSLSNLHIYPDLVASITDGLGANTTVAYAALADNTSNVYTKINGSAYPYQDVQDSTYVLSSFTQSNGIGGTNTTWAYYYGLKRYLTANTSLGFYVTRMVDPAGNLHDSYFNQTSQVGIEGTVFENITWAGGVRVKDVINTWTAKVSPLCSACTLAYLVSTTEQTTDLNGATFPSITTTYSNPDAYWNPQTITVSASDGYGKTTTNTYDNTTYVGQLRQVQVAATAPNQPGQTRTSSFTYDTLGRLQTESIEPNDTSGHIALTSTYYYDNFGNRTQKTVNGPDILTRNEYIRQYDARGQFMAWQKNALNQQTTYNNYDFRNGKLTKLTDPNNLVTLWAYNDGFARLTQGTPPDNNSITSISYYGCSDPAVGGTCPSLAVTAVATTTNGRGTTWAYLDILGREVRKQSQGLGGNWVYQDTAYDNLGRIHSVSLPYYSGATVYYKTYVDDALNRVTTVTEPGTADSCNSSGRTTTTSYNGLSTTVTNPKCQAKTTVKNSQGQVMSVTDAAGTVSYQYDPFGNLVQVTGVDNAVTAMTYDIRGRKRTMSDPDMGNWNYSYDALGELKSQTDAKNQTINMIYDVLGRMTTRSLPNGEGTGTWNYDTAANGVGKLASVSINSATKNYTYDGLSRVSSDMTSISGVVYTVGYTYDSYSRPLTLSYPVTGFTLYYVYDSYGNLNEVHQNNASGFRYWLAASADPYGRPIMETLGNSLVTSSGYDPATGDLLTIQTGVFGNPGSVQNSSYTYDALHNLTARSWWDGTTTDSESFAYDNLNRVTGVTGPANKTYAYYYNGSIQYKSDVGFYFYPSANGAHPHAVTQTGSFTQPWNNYSYDANGNMLTGWGRTITYTSFNKPNSITNSNGTTTLAYDANDNRLIKSNASGTTVYIGKLYENVSSGTTQRHYIYAGSRLVGVYTQNSNGTSNMRYFHTDHLGSVEVITDESHNVVQRLSYDTFGNRRNPNGTDASGIVAQTTRGFTEQEHDDEVRLINMNAREYDPLLGRFITPDTIVAGSFISQALNRYSYVNNNPLSLTDPSGHFSLGDIGSWISNAWHDVVDAGRSLVNDYKRFINWNVRVVEKARDNQYVRDAVAVVAAYYTAGAASDWFLSWAPDSAWATSAIASGSEAYVQGVQEAIYLGSYVVPGAAAGAVAGGITTGNVRGAVYGGITGGIFGGVSAYTQGWSAPGQIGARAVTGGVTADLQGGDFRTGFIYEGTSATASWGYQKVVGYMATGDVGRPLASPDGTYNPSLNDGRPPQFRNVFGLNSPLKEGDFWGNFFKQGGALSNIANYISGLPAVADFHDTWMNHIPNSMFNNIVTMPYAGIVTYGALLDGPLSVQLAVDRSR